MYRLASSIRSSSFFCCQLARADRSSFSIFSAPELASKRSRPRACVTFLPRTRSATRRILRGEVGTLRSLATASILALAFIFFGDVTTEVARRGEFAQLVPYHVLGHIHRDELIAVVNSERVANEIRGNHRAARPGLYHRFLAGRIEGRDFLFQPEVNVRPFFE